MTKLSSSIRSVIFSGIETVDREGWDYITAGHPFASWDWCRYGETVYNDQPKPYVIVYDGDEPIAGALFLILHTENMPGASPILQRGISWYLARRPLITTRTPPETHFNGIFLPDDDARRTQALTAIRAAGLKIVRQKHGSFLIFDYLSDSALDEDWGTFIPLPNFADMGRRLLITWDTYKDYLAAIRAHKSSYFADIRRNTNRARMAGIEVTYHDHITDMEQALVLIANVDEHHEVAPLPHVRQMLENAHLMPEMVWFTAHQRDELVVCALLQIDRHNRVCYPVLYGRNYEVQYAFLFLYYQMIRYAIEEVRATQFIGDTGAIELKERLGMTPDPRNNLVLASPSRLGHPLLRRLVRLFD